MTATVDSPIALPRRQATPGGEIVRVDGRGGGLRYIARAQNTLAVQHVGAYVCDAGSSTTPILTGTGAVAVWRVKNQLGNCTGLADASASVDIYVNGGTATVEATWTDNLGGTTTVNTVFTAAARSLRGIDADAIATDADYIDVTLEITAATATTVEIYGFLLAPVRSAADITPSSSQQTGVGDFIPLDDALTNSERPMTTALAYTLHANARHLYSLTGMALSCSRPESSTSTTQTAVVGVPESVDTMTVWVHATAPLIGSGSITILAGSSGITWSVTVTGWFALTATVTGLQSVQVTVSSSGSSPPARRAICAWFEDRDTTVLARIYLTDETGAYVTDELGDRIWSMT